MTKERILEIRNDAIERDLCGESLISLRTWDVQLLCDLAEHRLDMLASNRKRVAKRRRKIKREGRK